MVCSTGYILTPIVFHTKIKVNSNKLSTLFTSKLAFFSFGTEINKSKLVAFAAQSKYNFQIQESINILKTKQNKTMIMISQVAMQIRTNCARNEDTK